MKVLIICDPEEGSATELCLFFKAEAERTGRRVVLLNAEDDTRLPVKFDAVVIAATFESNAFGTTIRNYIDKYHLQLSELPVFFVTVVKCLDENNLQVQEKTKTEAIQQLNNLQLRVSQRVTIGVGMKFVDHQYITITDWPNLKIALQHFVIKNDLMMAG
jgi:menaquinone-dependent protoporphyrinogen IX oxidase